ANIGFSFTQICEEKRRLTNCKSSYNSGVMFKFPPINPQQRVIKDFCDRQSLVQEGFMQEAGGSKGRKLVQ
ncbi:MAG TPA: hypothetical protein V6C91_23355, partial [Coleofasciculaceae cyanobacterium]